MVRDIEMEAYSSLAFVQRRSSEAISRNGSLLVKYIFLFSLNPFDEFQFESDRIEIS